MKRSLLMIFFVFHRFTIDKIVSGLGYGFGGLYTCIMFSTTIRHTVA